MQGINDLGVLLASMQPVLHDEEYGIAHLPDGENVPDAFALIREDEGLTVIATKSAFGGQHGGWARISLTVHSDLAAVGLTAAFATALGAAGISANVIAGYFHDHIFLQWNQRDAAVAALQALSRAHSV